MTLSIEIVSIVVGLFSVALAVVAIWLSFKFFRVSNDALSRISESANRIAGDVERLEGLFNNLYSDTFSLMKDTVGDMRRHIWSNPDAEALIEDDADETPGRVAAAVAAELEPLLRRQDETEAKIAELTAELGSVFSVADTELRPVTPEEDLTAKERSVLHAIRAMSESEADVTFKSLWGRLESEMDSQEELVELLFRLHMHGLVHWNGAPAIITRESYLHLGDGRHRAGTVPLMRPGQ